MRRLHRFVPLVALPLLVLAASWSGQSRAAAAGALPTHELLGYWQDYTLSAWVQGTYAFMA
jgi:hypothetical protein